MVTSSPGVKIANKATASTLATSISTSYDLASLSCLIQVLHSNDLDRSQRESIWTVFESNMYNYYTNSSFGWDPVSKRKELFDLLSRFILVYRRGTSDLLAFLMFRFEVEEGEDIIYWGVYDIQVTSAAQGAGVGKSLLSELENLCQKYHMKKIVLTVLKANVKATEFYRAIGFVTDPTSPNYVDSSEDEDDSEELDEEEEEEEIVDYEILSKGIQ